MNKTLVDRFNAKTPEIKAKLAEKHPEDYEALVKLLVEHITADEYKEAALDPSRIHKIDDGDYQGTLLFVIAEKGYQPSNYWYVKVSYGSCSGCDTLQAINDTWDDKTPNEKQVNDYWTLCLHIVQGLRKMEHEL